LADSGGLSRSAADFDDRNLPRALRTRFNHTIAQGAYRPAVITRSTPRWQARANRNNTGKAMAVIGMQPNALSLSLSTSRQETGPARESGPLPSRRAWLPLTGRKEEKEEEREKGDAWLPRFAPSGPEKSRSSG